ncbi:hypothetical protein FRC12_009581 [Ceratobasidium sp. 428]|nr:hypothetical protein FRC09_008056 [Ceratobasidium sp. 395]KAG8760320.1 hypothetical protein FRC12_009581 [Ceratobasidium sp. 428]
MSSSDEEEGNNHGAGAIPRARRAAYAKDSCFVTCIVLLLTHTLLSRRATSLGISTGKIFTRTVDANAYFSSIVDYGLAMWRRQDTNQDEPQDASDQYLHRCFLALEKIFNGQRVPERDPRTLKTSLRDPVHGLSFRGKLCRNLTKGRSQARSDDKSVLCDLFLKHTELKKCASPGWIDDHCAKLLQTKNLDLDDPQQREALNLNHSDAPHNAAFAALYEDLALPANGDVAFQGYMRNEIFVGAMQAIFTGLGSGIGGSGSGSGERGKGAKAGMTSVSPANMAYVAMMLRFVLRRPGNWYNIKPGGKDKRYDYDAFYLATVSFLEAPVYAEELKELVAFLSRTVFPHSYDHPRAVAIPGGSGMAGLIAEAERVRAQRQAAAQPVGGE